MVVEEKAELRCKWAMGRGSYSKFFFDWFYFQIEKSEDVSRGLRKSGEHM